MMKQLDLFPPKTVYLAGPITGLSYGEARHGWREEFAGKLYSHIFPASPMRGKDELEGIECLTGAAEGYKEGLIAQPRSIVCRDRYDVMNCDAMVACFLGAYDRISIGTMIEFGWADYARKPIIMVIEPDNPHNHLMANTMAGYVLDDLDDAAKIVNQLLTPMV